MLESAASSVVIRHIAIQLKAVAVTVVMAATAGCGEGPLNNPYPEADSTANVIYSSFRERPNHLDPARSYSANEYALIGQIYEPPLQYHYLKRPYELAPLTAAAIPDPRYFDSDGRELRDVGIDTDVAYTVYDVQIKPGIRYQPHPAFARGADGEHRYQNLDPGVLQDIHTLSDFAHTGTRELVAADYIYQIKRLAHPALHSPILGIMSDYIVGLRAYAATLAKTWNEVQADGEGAYLDLTRYPLEGAEVVDRYTYRITVSGRYPQLRYWLAMPFFAPLPPEVDRFYAQPGMTDKNLVLDWYPVGTGPYMLTVNNPNRQMVLERNPNFHGERFPDVGEPGDAAQGLLRDAGKLLPFVDKVVFSLEKENIPYWNKFLQGYYDTSGVTSDSFDQAIRMGAEGEARLTDDMKRQGIKLQTAVTTSIFYMGFNMLDPVVGGYDERARLLRRAVSTAIDYEEYISIFANGQGIAAQGPIPPGIFGYREQRRGVNRYVYEWKNGQARRKPIEAARRLLEQAGYRNGIDENTGNPLVLHLDVTASGPDDKARLDWYRKQLDKLDIQLIVRNTDYNRFQDKMRNGNAQLFIWGWNADYPDPENFLFLLYGPNSKVKHHGENAANYSNPEFDALFEQMKNMRNGLRRQALIDEMLEIARRDAPWIWGFHPKRFSLYHSWYHNAKPNLMSNNTLKYKRIDPELRAELRAQWNRPILWPIAALAAIVIAGLVPAVVTYIRRERHAPSMSAADKA